MRVGVAISNFARDGICTTIGSGTGLRTARLAMNPTCKLIVLLISRGDKGDRGINPGTRLCSSGMISSLGERGEGEDGVALDAGTEAGGFGGGGGI